MQSAAEGESSGPRDDKLKVMTEEEHTGRVSTVVGIGASAGGLAVLRDLFSRLPPDTGLAFVVVVHLSPDQQSHLADLLQLHSSMPVHQVTASVRLESGKVYVIPPGRNLSAVDTHLRLSDLEEQRRNRSPIDHFFRTLADTHDGHAIGIVLTGTGTDGTVGLAAIKERGGLAIVQDPAEAEYDGMPRSAVTAGVVDLVLPVAGIADHLVRLARLEPRLPPIAEDGTLPADARQLLQRILGQIRGRTGNDMTGYKESTVWRRIRRRMQLHQIEEVDDYVELLRSDSDEGNLLFDDLLISVTSFFRDPEVFAALEHDVIPRLFEGKGPQDSVRAWSIGCSTGEEAYSLGMLLLEHAATLDEPPQLQLFATDLHAPSLQRAREGVYPASIEADLAPERLRRFFVRKNGSYQVREELRQVVVFAPHGLLKDPPFSHMDLISCRNLLIYLQRDMQRHAISVFHYALEPGGFLMLGTSETLDRSDLFTTLDKVHCFFRRRDIATREPPLPVFITTGPRAIEHRPEMATQSRPETGYGALHTRLVEQYAPPSILVDAEHRVVHYSHQVGRYLTHPGGDPTHDVFRLVHEDLRLEVRTTIHAARSELAPVIGRPVVVPIEGESRTVLVRAVPALDDGMEGFVLIVFEEIDDLLPITGGWAAEAGADATGDGDGAAGTGTVHQLEADLDVTRLRLQTIIERYETGQEEMKAANEELQSANEELRSTMEELETSKEELQSMNEELATLNQENRHKVEELSMLSSDLQNLLTATDIATLFLDRSLRIVRFTPPVTDIFNIVHSDRGRPLTDFTHRLRFDGLPADAQAVLDRLIPIEHEIQSQDGRWLLTRVLPYRTADDRIEGVVVTFVDITRRLEAEQSLRASERRLRLALDASIMGSWSWEPATGASDGDRRAFEILAAPPDGSFMSALEDLLDEDDRTRLRRHLLQGNARQPVQLDISRAGTDQRIVVELLAGHDDEAAGDQDRLIGTIRDVTERVAITDALAHRSERLALLSEAAAHLLRGTEPNRLLELLFDRMSVVLGLEVYERFDLDTRQRPRRSAWAGLDDEPTAADALSGLGAALCAQAVASRAPVIRTDVATSTDAATAALRGQRVTAFACFPLLAGSHVLGAVAFGTRGRRPFDSETIELIQTVADHLAVAQQRLEAEEELRALNESLEAAVVDRTRDLEVREQQFRTLVEASFQAVWTADDSGRISHSNPAWTVNERWTQQWPPTGWIDTVKPDQAEAARAAWDRSVRHRSALQIEVQLGNAASGQWRWTAVRALPLEGNGDRPQGWVGTILDIDERTRADQQLRSLASNLARAEARERQRMAEVLHDDLQQLLYGAQMRLQVVREFLPGDNDPPGWSGPAGAVTGEGVGPLTRQIMEAEQFVDDSLALARSLTGDLSPVTLNESDLGETLGWLADQMRDRHGLAVELELPTPLIVADTDARLVLYQCVRELLFNVVKHAEVERATVSSRVEDDSLVVCVADGGAGFDSEAILSDDERDGRGLANVTQRLHLIGASLAIESTPGQGTVAKVAIPLAATGAP